MMDYDPVAFVEEGSNGSRIGDGGGGSKGAPAGDGTGGGGDHLESKNSLGLTSLGSGRRGGEERREWVLHKLRGLVDSIEALEAVAYREREAHFNQGGLVGGCWVLMEGVGWWVQVGNSSTCIRQRLHSSR